MKHHTSTGAGSDGGKVEYILDGLLFPITRQSARNQSAGHQRNTTKAICTFMVPNKGASEYVKAVADLMSGCGCGRAILKKAMVNGRLSLLTKL